jgi:hypothetical protein
MIQTPSRPDDDNHKMKQKKSRFRHQKEHEQMREEKEEEEEEEEMEEEEMEEEEEEEGYLWAPQQALRMRKVAATVSPFDLWKIHLKLVDKQTLFAPPAPFLPSWGRH